MSKNIISKAVNKLYRECRYRFSSDLRYCRKVEGHLPLDQGLCLHDLAKRVPENGTVVEIGSYLGKSTCFIASGLMNRTHVEFIAIDTFQNQGMSEGARDTLAEFKKNIERYSRVVSVKKGFSHDVVKTVGELHIDMLWIDGNHEYESVKKDISDWVPMVVKGGLVCFHDYYPDGPEDRVLKAVNEEVERGRLEKVKIVQDYMLVTRKTGVEG